MPGLKDVAASFAGAARMMAGEAILYRLFVGENVNPRAGRAEKRYHEVAVRNVVKRSVTTKDIRPDAAEPYQVGDAVFVFPVAWLTESVPLAQSKTLSTTDRITHAGQDYRVLAVELLGLETLVRVTARKGN